MPNNIKILPTFAFTDRSFTKLSHSPVFREESDSGRLYPANQLDNLRGMASGKRDAEMMRFADAIITKAGRYVVDYSGTTHPGTVKVIRWTQNGQPNYTTMRLATWPDYPSARQGPIPPSGASGAPHPKTAASFIQIMPRKKPSPFSDSRASYRMARPPLCLVLSLLIAPAIAVDLPTPPTPPRELRGAWIATVRNIDWPSEPGLPTEKARSQLLALIQKAADLRLNALIFQVRPAGDAMYASQLEPWSPFLTGKMGSAPSPAWDPLGFAIEEAHKRGIELHAWFNPYRALAGEKHAASPDHILKMHPEHTMPYGIDKWMDPGIPEVRAQTVAVMLDVTRRYDVDGIHIDDYFYPYPVKAADGSMVPFPDEASYKTYQTSGGTLDKSHWRRQNVDTLVHELYDGIKATKKWVKFGISPFGLWRPNVPPGTGGGLDPYEELSADSLKWLHNGWLDYMVPQLYWPIEPAKLSFTTYYDWWLSQNRQNRHIWPGMAVDRVGKDRGPGEILQQISVVRQRGTIMTPGHFHWNFGSLIKNTLEVADLTKARAYQLKAIPPASPWLGPIELPAPTITTTIKNKQGHASWTMTDPRWLTHIRWWTLQTLNDGKWTLHSVHPVTTTEIPWPKNATAIAIRASDKTWTLSPPAVQVSP